MYKMMARKLLREDYINAMKEFDTYIDITVEDLMQLHNRAELYAHMRAKEGIRVAELMSKPVTTIRPDCTLADAAQLLVTRRISGLPVVDDQERLVGVVTEADFLQALGVPGHQPTHSIWHTLESMFSHHVEIKEPEGCVADLMVTDVITVTPEQRLHDVLEVLKKNRIKRVIVCDEAHHVVGMITRSDLVRIFFDRIRESTSNKQGNHCATD